MGRRRRSPSADRVDPPYGCARAGLLEPVARNRIKFIAIAIRFRQSRPDNPCPETAPSFSNDGYPAEKSVIAAGYDL